MKKTLPVDGNPTPILDSILKNGQELQQRDKLQREIIESEIEKSKASTNNQIQHRDSKSRSAIAVILTCAFIGLILVILVGAPIYNLIIGEKQPLDVESLLKTFNSIFGTLLGFALGYYFKGRKGE